MVTLSCMLLAYLFLTRLSRAVNKQSGLEVQINDRVLALSLRLGASSPAL